ncbi:MAG: hypothetical protein IKE57_04970 [Oscillospiraceae bacterium]|nr:hypothetical protein [Oscillospiraceae bacterium]
MAAKQKPEIPVYVSEREKHLIELMRTIDYGEIRVSVENYQPIEVLEMKRSVDLRSEQKKK